MPTLLHIDSSPLYGVSVSRELTAAFVEHWKLANPTGTVLRRDLNATQIAPLDATWIYASFTPDEARTPEQNQALALSDAFIAELNEATEYVIGVPMHNFSIPSALKLWIDQICRRGKTFAYEDGKPQGLITGKKATFAIATGGNYDAQTQMASFNFVEPYLRSIFSFLGVTEIHFQSAGGAMALQFGADRATFLAPHLEALKTHATTGLGGQA